jgi:hypothetical protein
MLKTEINGPAPGGGSVTTSGPPVVGVQLQAVLMALSGGGSVKVTVGAADGPALVTVTA